MSGHRYTATVRWSIEVRASASPLVVRAPYSDERAVDPEEAFVAAVSSCHMLFFLDYAAQDGYVVDDYDDRATATMGTNGEGRQFVESIVLAPRIRFSGARIPSGGDVDALHERAHHDCYIANSVTTRIAVRPRFADDR